MKKRYQRKRKSENSKLGGRKGVALERAEGRQ